jgi:hypothetical protein
VLYQRITFNNENFDKLPADYEAKWGSAMNLGENGRKSIKGHDISYYQDTIREVREKTLVEFRQRNDSWLLTPLKEEVWGGPANNYCLGFHVCEHISHHAVQIDLLMKRLPGAKAEEQGVRDSGGKLVICGDTFRTKSLPFLRGSCRQATHKLRRRAGWRAERPGSQNKPKMVSQCLTVVSTTTVIATITLTHDPRNTFHPNCSQLVLWRCHASNACRGSAFHT